MSEWNLSEKISCNCYDGDMYSEDVKEFIRLLKELKGIEKHKTVLREIDKLAGLDLI